MVVHSFRYEIVGKKKDFHPSGYRACLDAMLHAYYLIVELPPVQLALADISCPQPIEDINVLFSHEP